MKKSVKTLLALTLVLALALVLSACGGEGDIEEEYGEEPAEEETEESSGFDISEVQGVTWGIGFINGVEYEEHCANYDLDPETSNSFWTITDEDVTMEDGSGSFTYPIELTEEGFTVLDEANGTAIEVSFHPEDFTLSYEIDNGKALMAAVLVPYE